MRAAAVVLEAQQRAVRAGGGRRERDRDDAGRPRLQVDGQPVCEKPGPPEIVTPLTVTGTVPVFSRRTLSGHAAPTLTGPKCRAVLSSSAFGIPPRPRSSIETEPAGAFDV